MQIVVPWGWTQTPRKTEPEGKGLALDLQVWEDETSELRPKDKRRRHPMKAAKVSEHPGRCKGPEVGETLVSLGHCKEATLDSKTPSCHPMCWGNQGSWREAVSQVPGAGGHGAGLPGRAWVADSASLVRDRSHAPSLLDVREKPKSRLLCGKS